MRFKFLHLHLHGLIRSKNLELGRDADTGGQTQYVLELIKSLANTSEVDQVDLVTRLINDPKIDNDYSEKEQLIRLANHPSLVKTPNVEASAGAGSVIEIPEDMPSDLKPYIIQPSGQNLEGIMNCIRNKIDAIDRITHMGSVRGTSGQQISSGIALQTEFQLLNAKGISYYYKNYSIHYKHHKAAEKIFKKNYIFGIGIKNFRVESFKKKYNPPDDSMRGAMHPHQFHYEILSELGLIGYVLILGFLIHQIYYGLKLYKTKKDILVLSSSLFIFANIIPLLPSGSFFTTYTATIFWINYSLILKNRFS